MDCGISTYFHIVMGILGFIVGISCCGYNQFKCRKDFEKLSREPIDKLSDSKQSDMEDPEEMLLMTTVCACKPGDYPRCILED